MFDRLGEFLKDYIEEDDQDIFSNTDEEKESQKQSENDKNFENDKTEEFQSKIKTETNEKIQKKYSQQATKKEFKFENQDKKQNYFSHTQTKFSDSKPKTTPKIFVPFELHADFKTLCLLPGTSLEECKSAYKNLLKKYHPDKFANDEKKQKEATEITSSITTAFNRIKTWYENNLK